MSEFITLQVGQCGNQIGEAFWKLALREHGIQTLRNTNPQLPLGHSHSKLFDAFHSFFYIPENNVSKLRTLADLETFKIKARAVCIDMEDSVVARFQTGSLRHLFDETCLITNYPGSGNNWAEGFYTHGGRYKDRIVEAVRKATEKCDHLHGFLMLFSLGGGTGSGLGCATLGFLEDSFPHVDSSLSQDSNLCLLVNNYRELSATHVLARTLTNLATQSLAHTLASLAESLDPDNCMDVVYTPWIQGVVCYRGQSVRRVTGNEDVVTAPYNVTLATRELSQHATCVFPVHNKALMDICDRLRSGVESTETAKFIATCKPFHDMNSIIVNMLLHLTSGSRFPGCLNVDMNELSTNMVPFPGLHFISSGFSPMMLRKKHVSLDSRHGDLLNGAISRNNQLLKVDPMSGTLMSSAIIGRGALSMTDMRTNVAKLYERGRFVPWGRDAIKVGLCSVPPAVHPSALLCLLNSSNMSTLFQDVAGKFNRLYRRGAHVHHYLSVSEFEKDNFTESINSLMETATKYSSMETVKPIFRPRLVV
uniref:Tubulin epsilon chain n=1 Tax=Timema genevievae TaxID=629358 RepID=A0A7R9JSA9_TIMGE|nr:unnamed protein product [Timema genevievae]